MEKKVFVVGERDAVLGFSLLGVDGLATDDVAAATARIEALQRDSEVGLILVTAGIAGRMGPALERLMAATSLPLIYVIPDRGGRLPEEPLRDLLRRALGVPAAGL